MFVLGIRHWCLTSSAEFSRNVWHRICKRCPLQCNISMPAIKRHEGLAVRCWEGSISGWAWIIVPPIGVRSWKKSRWWWRKSFYIGIMVNSKRSLKPHFKCQEVAYPRKVFLIFQEGVNTKSRDIQLIHGYVSHMLGKMLPKRQWIVLRNLKHKRDSPYV